jgi:uncharacterized protein
MLERAYDILIKWKIVVILIIAVLTGFFIYRCMSYTLLDDPNRWPPKNNPNVVLNDHMQECFGGANSVTIQITKKDGDIFNPVTLKKIDDITYKLSIIDGIIPYNLYSLSAAVRVRYLKNTEEMMENTPLMEEVPKDQAGIERVRWGVEHNPTVANVLVSPDFKSTLIRADFRTTQPPTSKFALPLTDPIAIYKQVTAIIEPENDMNHTVRCVGTPIIIGWVNSKGLPYVYTAFLISVVGVLIVLIVSLKKKRAIALALCYGLMSIVWGFGVNSLLFGNVLRSSSAFIAPFIIMAAATCHAVQFFRRFLFEEHVPGVDASVAIKQTSVALSRPIVISLVADCSAFLVLAFVPFDNVSVMGKITFLGLLSAIVCLYMFVVPLLSLFPPAPLLKTVESTGDNAKKFGNAVERAINESVRLLIYPSKFRWITMSCLALLLVGSLFVMTKIKTGQDNSYAIHNYLTKSYNKNPIFLMEREFKKYFKGVYTLSILIEAKEAGGLLEPKILRKVDEFASFFSTLPEVAGTSSMADAMKLMNGFFNSYNVIDPGKCVIPDRKAEAVYYYNGMLDGEPGATEGVVDQDLRTMPLYVYVEDTKPEVVEKIFTASATYARDHFNDDQVVAKVGGGDIGIAKAFNDNIYKWLIWSFVLSAAATFVVCWCVIGSAVGGIYLLIPLCVGTVIWLAAVYLLGIEINSNTSGGMAIASGVGVDAEVYLLYRFREEFAKSRDFRQALVDSFTKIRMALIYSTGALVIGLFILVPIPLYIGYVGFTMGLIISLCFLVSFIVSPVLWSVFRPAFLLRSSDRGNGKA